MQVASAPPSRRSWFPPNMARVTPHLRSGPPPRGEGLCHPGYWPLLGALVVGSAAHRCRPEWAGKAPRHDSAGSGTYGGFANRTGRGRRPPALRLGAFSSKIAHSSSGTRAKASWTREVRQERSRQELYRKRQPKSLYEETGKRRNSVLVQKIGEGRRIGATSGRPGPAGPARSNVSRTWRLARPEAKAPLAWAPFRRTAPDRGSGQSEMAARRSGRRP